MDLSDIKQANWRQGHFLPKELVEQLGKSDVDVVVLLSQDCDLQNAELGKEPFAEAICGYYGEGLEKRPQNSPRYVVLNVQQQQQSRLVEFRVHDRFCFGREKLIGYRPDTTRSLAPVERRKLIRMIVKRYDRPAFPDSFNERLVPALQGKAKDNVRRILQANADVISGVYLRLEPSDEELPMEERYRLAIMLTQRVTDYDNKAHRDRAEQATIQIESVIRTKCSGIDIGPADDPNIKLSPEDVVTIDERRLWTAWDWDYLSSGEEDDLPVEAP